MLLSAMRRPAAALLALGLAATGVLGTPSAQAAPADPAPAAKPSGPLRYVALGDSYSSAAGVQPYQPGAPADCMRSTVNFASVIAGATGARVRDVTCSGAETRDFFSSQSDGVPPQLDALGLGTQLVTMTIGGNDSGVFIDTIQTCGTAGATTGGTGSPCKDQNGSRFVDTVRKKTYPALVKALRAVHRKAPRARVAILGYPEILPPTVGCYPQMPVATGDVPYLHHFQDVLNNVVRRAAAKTGSVYVNTPRASVGHDACQLPGTRWIEPVLGGTNPVVVHPNAKGEDAMARVALNKLRLR